MLIAYFKHSFSHVQPETGGSKLSTTTITRSASSAPCVKQIWRDSPSLQKVADHSASHMHAEGPARRSLHNEFDAISTTHRRSGLRDLSFNSLLLSISLRIVRCSGVGSDGQWEVPLTLLVTDPIMCLFGGARFRLHLIKLV